MTDTQKALEEIRKDIEDMVDTHIIIDKIRAALEAKAVPEVKDGGVEDVIPYEVAKKYAIHYVNMEMRDPCGLNKEAKVMLALMKEIVQLNDIIKGLRK